ncbi:MAG: cytochrome C oxidase subunit IV family protein [Planctomycetes bacterium]|nr:cytochrome C oxidase subunit IV family protein [Planctomycetota bacterium]
MSGHTQHHIVPLRHYIGVFVALIVLTAATYLTALIDMGPLNTPVAMAIAIVKALLVILIFMHVKYSNRLIQTMVIASALWLMIMFGFAGGDYLTRGWISG